MITKEKILSATNNGIDIFSHYIPDFKQERKLFLSPLREEKTPSANVYKNGSGVYYFKDFAGEHLGPIDFVMKKYALEFPEALKRINQDLGLFLDDRPKKPSSILSGITEREFQPYELEYFRQYGITGDILKKYDVCSIESYCREKDGKKYTFKASDKDFCIGYRVNPGKDYKLYFPLRTKDDKRSRFVWYGNIPQNYTFGLSQLPESGELVIIAAGEKDCLTLVAHGYNAISFNSEAAHPDKSLIEELKKRFQTVAILYDLDEPGQKSSKKLSEQFGLKEIILPESVKLYGKDVSDYYKEYYSEKPVIDPIEQPEAMPEPGKLKELIYDSISGKKDPLFIRLQDLLFDAEREIPKPEPIISIEGNIISTAGNISVIKGPSKSGKSGVLSGMIGGAMAMQGDIVDTCGIEVKPNTAGKLVLHIDTEQSQYDHFRSVQNILRRTNREKEPAYFKSVFMRQLSYAERKAGLELLLDVYAREFNGVHSIIIDGIADFVSSVNDEQECNEIVHFFERLAIKYSCPVITVIHLNPSSESKGRGHLDSQLERKAESVLTVRKDKGNDVSWIEGTLLRNAGTIPQIQFQYDLERGYHVGLGARVQIAPEERKKIELRELAESIFDNGRCKFTYSDLVSEIMETEAVKERSAKSKIALMKQHGIIDNEGDMKSKLYLVQGCKIGANG